MNIKTRSITARPVLIGGLAAPGAAIVPGAAGAGCTGNVIEATANHQTLYGAGCDDTFKIGRYAHVTIYAGNGNDTVRAGFHGNYGTNYLYLEGGNDIVLNPSDKPVWVSGGAGNDKVEGSSGYDAFYGGPGTDSFEATPGDFYQDVENFL